jgi:nucleotide-binding universal stress UspA family protein
MPGVIVGVDDSKEAREALDWALRYAHNERLAVTVITVVDPLMGTALWDTDPLTDPASSILNAARTEAQELVAEAVDVTHADDVDVDVQAVVGHPVRELVDAAEGADLVVVGSRGAGTFARLLLGSTSSGVAHHAPCSVMIVRASDAAGPAPERLA